MKEGNDDQLPGKQINKAKRDHLLWMDSVFLCSLNIKMEIWLGYYYEIEWENLVLKLSFKYREPHV